MRQALTITYPITAKEFSGLIRKAKDGRVRQRLMAMNFIAQGHTIPQVATRLDIAERPLRKWLHRFNAQGPEGLKDAYRSGQPPKLTNEVIEQFKSRVRQGVTQTDTVCSLRAKDIQQILQNPYHFPFFWPKEKEIQQLILHFHDFLLIIDYLKGNIHLSPENGMKCVKIILPVN